MKTGSKKYSENKKKEEEKTLLEAQRLLLLGVPESEIILKLKEDTDEEAAKKAISEARAMFKKLAEPDEDEEIGKAVERSGMIIAKSSRVQDFKTSISAQKLLSETLRQKKRNQPVKNILKKYNQNKAGRNTIYNEDIINDILNRLSSGELLIDILKDNGMPSIPCFYRWMEEKGDLKESYARARKVAASLYVEHGLVILDNSSPEDIQVNNSRANYRRWMAEKFSPVQFGDRQAVELTGKNGGPMESITINEAMASDALARLDEIRRKRAAEEKEEDGREVS